VHGPRAEPPAYFKALGDAVSQTWSGMGRRQSALPDAAQHALSSVELPEGLDAVGLLSWAASTGALPVQTKLTDNFGQPPLVLYRADDFYVQAITWMEGTTSVHQHGFAGAFMVLQGASLHVEHSFAAGEYLAEDRIVLGELGLRQPEVLRPRQVRRIEPGGAFIHALFHLERPTVTVVVRNESCDLPLPQYNYWRPGLGYDALWQDRTWSRRLQSIDAVAALDPDTGRRTAREIVGSAPLWEAFSMVVHWCSRHGWNETTIDLIDLLAAREGSLGSVIAPALEQEVHLRRIIARRGMLHELHQRLLLALLANLPDTASITAALHQLFPGQAPSRLLLDWVEELSAPSLRGITGLSIPPARLAELRARPTDGSEQEVLTEVRAAWGEPLTLTGIFR
jgi:hypothetical protein